MILHVLDLIHAAFPTIDNINDAVDIFYAAIATVDPREALLRQAHTLGINSSIATGETVEDLLSELSFAQGADRQAVLAKVEAANFGIGRDKTLADMIAARLADHAPFGGYHDLGLGGDEARIAAFHYHLEQAQREAVAAVTVALEDHEMIRLGQGVKNMFDDGILEGAADSVDGMLAHLSQLPVRIIQIQAVISQLAQPLAPCRVVLSSTASHTGHSDSSDDGMPLFD